ncbi:MAG: hypothetical protein LBL93_01750 [Ruminococcus sp.]|nr:hypothetical protein [Ruminococcus sp.]
MQLLRITSVPIELKIQIERAHFKRQEAERNARTADVSVENIDKQIKSLEKKVETSEAKSDTKKTDENGKNGGEYSSSKNKDVDKSVTGEEKISSISVVKHSEQFIDIKQAANSAKSNKNEVNVALRPENLTGEDEASKKIRKHYEELNKAIYEYVRGEVNLEVEKNPEVKVEYIGGFIYVPPESNPDYEGE